MDYLRIRDHLTQAESCFRQGLAADPDHPECLLYLAVTLRNLGRFKEADRLLRHALEISPMDPVVHMQVGTLRRWQKRLHESLQAYDAALLIDPTHVNTRVARAITLQEMNRWEQALKGYDQLISELTTEEVEGNALPRRRREVAEILARIASNGLDMKLEPQALAVALYHKANQLVLEGKVDAALVLYQDAAKLGPDYSDPTFPIGETVAIQTQRKPEGDYLSCPWIEGCLHLHHDRLAFCCNTHERGKDWPIMGPIPVAPCRWTLSLPDASNSGARTRPVKTTAAWGAPTWSGVHGSAPGPLLTCLFSTRIPSATRNVISAFWPRLISQYLPISTWPDRS